MLDAMKEKISDSQIAHKIRVYADNGPRVSVVFFAVLILAGVLAAPVYGWHVKKERDKWWRAEIAKQSQAVRGVIERGTAEAEATDAEIIAALGETDGALETARKKLAQANKPVAGCIPIPARCLGMR